jgi:hypothetical protein
VWEFGSLWDLRQVVSHLNNIQFHTSTPSY